MSIKGFYRHIHPFNQLLFVAFMAFATFMGVTIVGLLVGWPFFGTQAFLQLLRGEIYASTEALPLLKYIQLLQSVGLFVVPPFVVAHLLSENSTGYLKINKRPNFLSLILSLLIIWSASPLINELGLWNSGLVLPDWLSGVEQWMHEKESAAEDLTNLFLISESVWGLLFNIVLIGMIPAIGEELLFRGVVQNIFTRWTRNQHLGIWLTAALFSSLHFQFYGFVPRMFLGALFGYMLVWSGNLWLPIASHFINNATAVMAYYLYEKDFIHVDPDQLGTHSAYDISVIISIVLVAVLAYMFRKNEHDGLLKGKFGLQK